MEDASDVCLYLTFCGDMSNDILIDAEVLDDIRYLISRCDRARSPVLICTFELTVADDSSSDDNAIDESSSNDSTSDGGTSDSLDILEKDRTKLVFNNLLPLVKSLPKPGRYLRSLQICHTHRARHTYTHTDPTRDTLCHAQPKYELGRGRDCSLDRAQDHSRRGRRDLRFRAV